MDLHPRAVVPVRRTNLPVALSRFVGRVAEQAAVRAALADTRLLTLTGAGGCGKTRLALAVAETVREQYRDGVWLVDLAPVSEAAGVAAVVAQALRLAEERDQPPLATLQRWVGGRELLLLLDNCEHLVGACAQVVAALLRSGARLRVLATSQEALGIGGETVWRVPSLGLPSAAEAAQVAASEAAQLFLARARQVLPTFSLTAETAGPVAELCRRLDGIPLALELAAARLAVLTLDQVLARLNDRFRLLVSRERGVIPRQRTLRATMEWSYGLLSEAEQGLLRRLAVFAGGWELEGAGAICAGPLWGGGHPSQAAGGSQTEARRSGDGAVAEAAVLDLLAELVRKSLVQVEEHTPRVASRYRLLETVRAFAAEQWAATGEERATRERHLGYYLALAEAAERELKGPEQATWLWRLAGEHDNLRAALRWAAAVGEGERGLRLAGALWPFWHKHGHSREGRDWLEGALATAADAVAAPVRAKALNGSGGLAIEQGDYARAQAFLEESLALWRRLDDRHRIAASLANLGTVAAHQGQNERAAAFCEEDLAIQRALGDTHGIAVALQNLGAVAKQLGQLARAGAFYAESLALFRQMRDPFSTASALSGLGALACRQGHYQEAEALLEEALTLQHKLGNTPSSTFTLVRLATAAREAGVYGRALARFGEAAALYLALARKPGLADLLEGLAELAWALEQPACAARLCGAAEQARAAVGEPVWAEDRASHEALLARTRVVLGEEGYAAAWAAGQGASAEQLTSEALALLAASPLLIGESPAMPAGAQAAATVPGRC